MAIDRIPGVGPTNADIATAVAAPSAATIAAAVAAPSAATIASTVASSVPTLAQITSTVQANAGSPFGGTITNLGVVTASNISTTTFSSLSSYKYLKFYIMVGSAASDQLYMRFNGDTANNYRWGVTTDRGTGQSTHSINDQWFNIDNGSGSSHSQIRSWTIEIPMSNSGAYKTYTGFGPGTSDSAAPSLGWCHGLWNSTTAISSVTFLMGGGTNFANTRIYGIGAA